MPKKVFMIAGPNGAGKTTIAFSFFPELEKHYEFINADEIAKGLAPLHPETMALTASKLMVKRLKELMDADQNFVFETTAAGKNYIKHLEEAKRRGYETSLIFLWLSSPDQAIKRVSQRVSQGGHNIPAEVIERRYWAGIKNLVKHYLPIVDRAFIINNSIQGLPSSVFKKTSSETFEIRNKTVWQKILEVANG